MEDQSSDRGPQGDQSIQQAMRALIENIARIFSGLKRWLKSGTGILLSVSAFAFGTGGATGHFIPDILSHSSSSSASAALIGIPTPEDANNPKFIPLVAGFIKNATVTDTDHKQFPHDEEFNLDGSANPPDTYIVAIEFTKPDNCSNDCKQALDSLIGNGDKDCDKCVAILENVDQREGKNSSGTLDASIKKYEEHKQKVDILFSGHRDEPHNRHANILLMKPSN